MDWIAQGEKKQLGVVILLILIEDLIIYIIFILSNWSN